MVLRRSGFFYLVRITILRSSLDAQQKGCIPALFEKSDDSLVSRLIAVVVIQ